MLTSLPCRDFTLDIHRSQISRSAGHARNEGDKWKTSRPTKNPTPVIENLYESFTLPSMSRISGIITFDTPNISFNSCVYCVIDIVCRVSFSFRSFR